MEVKTHHQPTFPSETRSFIKVESGTIERTTVTVPRRDLSTGETALKSCWWRLVCQTPERAPITTSAGLTARERRHGKQRGHFEASTWGEAWVSARPVSSTRQSVDTLDFMFMMQKALSPLTTASSPALNKPPNPRGTEQNSWFYHD